MTQSGGEGSGVIYKLDPAGHYTVLHSFSPADDGLAAPDSVLVQDAAGNLYGTTQAGGAAGVGAAYELDTAGSLTILYSFPPRAPSSPIRNMSAPGLTIDPAGNLFGVVEVGTGTAEGGLVYMLNAARAETTIYSFSPAPGGTSPFAGVVLDAAGNLYGTTSSDDTPGSEPNWGLVYQVDPAGNEQVLYNFTGGADGGYPQGGVIRDAGGRLYGTAWSGGAANLGVVFELSPSGKQTVLHSFTGGSDGQQPVAGVIRDADGNLYGTTPTGGNTACDGGCGVVFKIDPSGQESILYSFTGGEGGSAPLASLTQDSEGNLYGTAFNGGAGDCGVVFKVDPAGNQTLLYAFTRRPGDGCNPQAPLIRDADGNLYGTTLYSAGEGCFDGGCGIVFQIDPAGNETVLYHFTGEADGGIPMAGVIRDAAGNLYGATTGGGSGVGVNGCGVVYELNASGQEMVLHTFTGALLDGCGPWAGLAADATRNLYGTAPYDGPGDGGVLYKITF